MRRALWWCWLLIVPCMALTSCSFLNRYHHEGTLRLPGLTAPVRVLRDHKGMAYIHARHLDDALLAQGFVTAQDRLFQMELMRRFASGRISELAGEKAKGLDIRMRTIGFHRNAQKHAKLLNPRTRRFFEAYLAGVNAYVETRTRTHPLEFKLAGIKPEKWTTADSLAIAYYLSWDSSANLKTEIAAQMLAEKVGLQKAREIFPLNINPDESNPACRDPHAVIRRGPRLGLLSDPRIMDRLRVGALQMGSNNWAVDPQSSPNGKPILANDPHQDPRILTGPWYPIGIITPEHRLVGAGIPGTPGIVMGRNAHIAVGVTNACGDVQDLYVERLDPKDPGHYLEGRTSLPFEVIEETLKIKDKEAPGGLRTEKIRIRLTRRGPVISGLLPGLVTKKVLTLRWAPFITMGPCLGIDRIMLARSVREIREALSKVNWISLNYVFADKEGNIGWHVSGKLPVRSQKDGTLPFEVTDGRDNWTGWIPFDRMPHRYNPPKGWVGTCNHKTVTRDYPYYYSSHMSPSYRYRRLKQLLGTPGKKPAETHWQYQRDTLNLMAKALAPVMATALLDHEDTREMGRILSQWDFRDDPHKAAPAIFQAVYRQFAFRVFQDELGEDLARAMLSNWYFWQERLQQMVLAGDSPWFDNVITTDRKETRDDLFHLAALEAQKDLRSRLGRNPNKWLWGKVHRLIFVSPVRRKGIGKGWVGGGTHAAPGSGEALYRSIYAFNKPFDVTITASLRMVADLGDEDKVLAVLPGGVSGRLFDPHTTDQIDLYMGGDKAYWWFSDRAIKDHCVSTLVLHHQ